MATDTPTQPAGWYPDPANPGTENYWTASGHCDGSSREVSVGRSFCCDASLPLRRPHQPVAVIVIVGLFFWPLWLLILLVKKHPFCDACGKMSAGPRQACS